MRAEEELENAQDRTLLARGYNLNRWYEAGTGRYSAVDPVRRKAAARPYAYARLHPLRFVDPLGLTTWDCSLSVGGADVPAPIGAAGAMIDADCKSRCQCGKQIRAHLTGGFVGVGFLLPVFGTTASMELSDDSNFPNAQSLQGPAGIGSAGAASPWAGAECAGVRLGSAKGVDCGGAKGVKFGADVLVGYVGVTNSFEGPCCKDTPK